jgi:hypothetical protein
MDCFLSPMVGWHEESFPSLAKKVREKRSGISKELRVKQEGFFPKCSGILPVFSMFQGTPAMP